MTTSSAVIGSLSSFPSKKGRDTMVFTPEWGIGPVFDWYRQRHQSSPQSVCVDRLEIRIDNGKIPHRFILVRLLDSQIIRFDRRPLTSKPGTLILETIGGLSTRKAADEYEELTQKGLEEVNSSTKCEMSLKMPPDTTLLHIISACFSLSQDSKALHYELLKFNCYFFSWTIVMLVARHTHKFAMPSPLGVEERLLPEIDRLADYITAKIVKGLLDFVIQTVTRFRDVTGRSLDKGLGKRELLVWRLPTGAVNWALGIFLRFRLHLGLEDDLRAKAKQKITEHIGPILQEILNKQGEITEKQISQRLWVDDFSEDFRSISRGSVTKILWSALLETLAEGYGKVTGEQLIDKFKNHPNPLYRLKYHMYGKNVMQFTQIWNDALNAALPAARDKFESMVLLQTRAVGDTY